MRKHHLRSLALWLLLAPAAQLAQAGAYIFAGEQYGTDLVAHPNGWTTSTRGELAVRVCITPGTPNAGVMTNSVQNIVDRFNLGVSTVGNVRLGSNNDLNASEIDFESTAIHEVGHCLGLAHSNLASESGESGDDRNYTKSTNGGDDSFDLGVGSDGVRGSPDDNRGDDVNLHWFEVGVNDPFDVADIVDENNYSNQDTDLPSSDNFAANGDRDVSALFGYPATEAIMQQGAFFDEDQRALSADDMATLKFARTGRDRVFGTGDDYQVVLEYGGISSSSQCDINLAFDDMETGFAVCQASASLVSNDYARFTSSDSYFNTGFNWHFSSRRIPFPAPDAITVNTLGTATELTNSDDSLLANDVDQNSGQGLVVSTQPSREPQHGTVTLTEDGTFSYTNTNAKATTDSFQYRVCVDNTNPPETTCAHQNVSIAIVENGPPTAQSDNLQLAEGAHTSQVDGGASSLLANDSDPEGIATLTVTTTPALAPEHGSVTLAADGSFTYTHDGGEQFSDTFHYEVCDNFDLCDIGTVAISISEVNDNPVAGNDPLPSVQEDSTTFSTAIADLLQNDSAGNGETTQTLTITELAGVAGGEVEIDGSFIHFTPSPNYFGPGGYTYTATDDGTTNGQPDPATDTATVSFSISEVNDPPVAADDTLSDISEDSPQYSVSLSTLTGNDSPGPPNEDTQTLDVVAINNPVGLDVTVLNDNLLLLVQEDYFGPATFEYVVSDNGSTAGSPDPLQSSGLVTLSITEFNDPPVTQVDALPPTSEGADPVQFALTDLLINDSPGPANESSQSLTLLGVNEAQGGVLTVEGNIATWTFDPDFSGLASLTYIVEDNGTTATAQDPRTAEGLVTLSVVGENDAPLAADDILTPQSSGDVKVIPADLLLVNDLPGPDAESTQTVRVTEVFDAVGGSATLQDDEITFLVDEGFVGTAQFSYRIEDNGTTDNLPDFLTAVASVTFPIAGENLAPLALADTLFVRRGQIADQLTSLSGSLLENDSDPNGDSLSVSAMAQNKPASGTVTLNTNGTFIYKHNGDAASFDTFTYEVCDAAANSLCTTAEVTVIIADEDVFSCAGNLVAASAGLPTVIPYLQTFPELPLTFTVEGLPASLSLNSNDGVIEGTPTGADASAMPYAVTVSGTSDTGSRFDLMFSVLVTEEPDIMFYTGHELRCGFQ